LSKNFLFIFRYKVENESTLYLGNLEEDYNKWDQFELNKTKFNVSTSYDENHYTTRLDYNAIPIQIKQKADKIEKELLECDTTFNIHIKEERGLISQTECDEEIKYSTVIREEMK
jgi:PAB1-binding protein PBP1